MEFIQNLFKAWFGPSVEVKINTANMGPNTLDELLKQFSIPPKEKTDAEIIRDYQIKETMAALELDMLRMDPTMTFRGNQRFKDEHGNIFFDFVPCAVRPEVIYCCNGKS